MWNPTSQKLMRRFIGKLMSLALGKRLLLPNCLSRGTEASDLINRIIELRQRGGRYLEVGVENALTFEAVKLRHRVGVDPFPRFSVSFLTPWVKFHKLTSNVFFEANREFFDIIYLDGLHTAEQTLVDLHNSLKKLSKGGVIMIDDTIPIDEFSALPDQNEAYRLRKMIGNSDDMSWHGDVYKVINVINQFKQKNLNIATITTLKNPKTIIWSDSETTYPNWEPDNFLDVLHARDFKSTFVEGIPESFMPMSQANFEKVFSKSYKSISE